MDKRIQHLDYNTTLLPGTWRIIASSRGASSEIRVLAYMHDGCYETGMINARNVSPDGYAINVACTACGERVALYFDGYAIITQEEARA